MYVMRKFSFCCQTNKMMVNHLNRTFTRTKYLIYQFPKRRAVIFPYMFFRFLGSAHVIGNSGIKSATSIEPVATLLDRFFVFPQMLERMVDNDKIKRLLGWEPKVDFEEGMRKTIAWYKSEILKK